MQPVIPRLSRNMKKPKVIKAWAVYVDDIGIEWSDGNECLAIYEDRENARNRQTQATDYYRLVRVEIRILSSKSRRTKPKTPQHKPAEAS
jgi:hypothetical protein